MNADFEKRPEPVNEKARNLEVCGAGGWTIQPATLENLHELVELEEACFSVPWSRKSFEAELTENQFSRMLMIPHPEDGQKVQVIGYICIWIVFEEIRFLNLAIHPEFRREGLAGQLIGESLRIGREAGSCRGMLEVRESNHAARNLYESFHFRAYARRKSYYTNPTEDAILMILEPLAPLKHERREERGQPIGSQTTIHTIS